MHVNVEIGDPVDIHIHRCDRQKIDEQFPGVIKWQGGNLDGMFDGMPFEYADLKIGEITIKFFT